MCPCKRCVLLDAASVCADNVIFHLFDTLHLTFFVLRSSGKPASEFDGLFLGLLRVSFFFVLVGERWVIVLKVPNTTAKVSLVLELWHRSVATDCVGITREWERGMIDTPALVFAS